MAKFSYTPRGVCSAKIDFEIEDGIVKNVSFFGFYFIISNKRHYKTIGNSKLVIP